MSKFNCENIKVIVSGGGTGGHIYPALSIAGEIKKQCKNADILFVGALGRMEMEIIPKAGYEIVGLPVKGLIRKITFQNFVILYRLWQSMRMAKKIVKQFQPNVVIGVGGYASGPVLKSAAKLGIPTIIQEQNSYAGITNKLLGKSAKKICVAYERMDRFFPAKKIILTGNPIRKEFLEPLPPKKEALAFFKIPSNKKVVLIIGGSLGARSINRGMMAGIGEIEKNLETFFIWQTGKNNFDSIKNKLGSNIPENVIVTKFIDRMDMAFSSADLIVSRAGAGTISELCIVGKPVILIPSPNVSEDHQTKNAMALVNKDAAVILKDKKAETDLVSVILENLKKEANLVFMSENIKRLEKPLATEKIVDVVFETIK